MDKTIYAVSSLRDYGDGEVYFSTDGLFLTIQEAEDYIREDIREIRGNYSALYDEDIPAAVIDMDGDDMTDCRIFFDDHRFLWRIDEFEADRLVQQLEENKEE